ncbi:MAG: hypothetical protein E5X41_14850 [Mesorhizobium sp.]|nr:MAG: hypothetical protein E5X41_14850 [Mesorhizobium sp.]
MKRILHGLLAVWPPLSLAALSFGLAASPTPGYFDLGPWDNLAVALAGLTFSSDAGARFAEYRKARDLLALSRHSNTMLGASFYQLATLHKRSWCQRTALLWAASDALGPNGRQIVKLYYKALGYRWWHVTPDGTFSRQSPFLKVNFWASVVGFRGAKA